MGHHHGGGVGGYLVVEYGRIRTLNSSNPTADVSNTARWKAAGVGGWGSHRDRLLPRGQKVSSAKQRTNHGDKDAPVTSALMLTQLHHHVRPALKYLTEVSHPQCNTASVPPSSISSL